MNVIIVQGNITKDAELSYSKNGMAVLKYTVAVSRGKDKGSDFFNCVLFGKYAESLSGYMVKGLKVIVKGKINIDNKKLDDGSYRTYISLVAEEVKLLTSSKTSENDFKDTPFEDMGDTPW